MFEQKGKWRGSVSGPFLTGAVVRGCDEFNVTQIIKNESSSLCRQPNVEEQGQSGAALKAPTNSLCKSMSVGQFVPNK